MAKAKKGKSKLVSITEAAALNKVTRQAIYVAIKLGKLKASKDGSRWKIDVKDLIDYRKHKYSRAKSIHRGELIFDPKKGRFSVNQVAKILKVPAQKIYYATRIGLLKATRKGAAWVIDRKFVEDYQKNYLKGKRRKRKAS